jgi:hypothetical protein
MVFAAKEAFTSIASPLSQIRRCIFLISKIFTESMGEKINSGVSGNAAVLS